jgi:hypothetical protein
MLPPPSILCLRPKLLVHQTDSTSPYSVFAIMIPTALFTALNRGSIEPSTEATALISDASRGDFLKMSRGVAIILLVICEWLFCFSAFWMVWVVVQWSAWGWRGCEDHDERDKCGRMIQITTRRTDAYKY